MDESFLDHFQTGDILLFNGQGFWFSYVVEWATWSDYSHIGIVLKDPIYLKPELKGLYMLESGTEKFPDAIEHRICYGVQVVNLKKVIDSYIGRIYYRKLEKIVSEESLSDLGCKINNAHVKMSKTLKEIWPKIRDHGYDDRLWDLFRAEINLNWGDNHRIDKFICSALVSYLYQKAEIFKNEIEWDLIKPYDYAPKGKIETKYLKNEYKLGALMNIK